MRSPPHAVPLPRQQRSCRPRSRPLQARSSSRRCWKAVQQIDHVTQQNAALVEQNAAAADGLRQQAQQLVNAVAVFQLGQPAAALERAA